jgi:ParB family chromosome partitioning protein
MAQKIALGKGIASLIQERPSSLAAAAATLEQTTKGPLEEMGSPLLVDVSQIKTNPNQPRKIFKEKELEELAESIRQNGIIQPLIVVKADRGFELVAGERRLRAAKLAGLEKVPVVLKRGTDREKMIMSIIENVQRTDLNCVEEALAYYSLMEEYKLTQEEVAKKVGKERSTVANFLRVLKLPRPIIDFLQKELLSFGHAKVLAAVSDRDHVLNLANQAVANELSVRELEKLAKAPRSGVKNAKEKQRDELVQQKIDQFRQTLEQRTGFHFGLKAKKNWSGQLTVKFTNEAEFNDIYEYLLKRN